MNLSRLDFDVTAFDVRVAEGVKMKWDGREIESGPLVVALGAPGSCGFIDYGANMVRVEFKMQIRFEEFAETLEDMGADPDLAAPITGVVRSEGLVFDNDHSLRLCGRAELAPHRLFDPAETSIEIRAPSH
ncbi:MAG TPA: hypothetical protein VHT91_48845 [Kofleriaceae bacterium]|jgi:hypothetical protein|nr:hypothetical protein [Kofleriaceae bacterium]